MRMREALQDWDQDRSEPQRATTQTPAENKKHNTEEPVCEEDWLREEN